MVRIHPRLPILQDSCISLSNRAGWRALAHDPHAFHAGQSGVGRHEREFEDLRRRREEAVDRIVVTSLEGAARKGDLTRQRRLGDRRPLEGFADPIGSRTVIDSVIGLSVMPG